jgi:hypothetical protein
MKRACFADVLGIVLSYLPGSAIPPHLGDITSTARTCGYGGIEDRRSKQIVDDHTLANIGSIDQG